MELQKTRGSVIAAIDVIARSPKLSGRGMSKLKDVPIADFAEQNSLSLFRADKRRDFDSLLQNNYDLAIAVSYGRLIPFDFLKSIPFGGLNVHPSLLPKHSGPAPLQRALLENDETSGVTVQTLHPTEFDKGDILSMEEYQIKDDETLQSLTQTLSVLGGSMLRNVLVNCLFDSSSPKYKIIESHQPFTYASKVTKDDSKILWDEFTNLQILKRQATLGNLFTYKLALPKKKNKDASLKRIVFTNLQTYTPPNNKELSLVEPGSFTLDDDSFIIKTLDGYLTPECVSTEGLGSEPGNKFFSSLKKKFNTIDYNFTA